MSALTRVVLQLSRNPGFPDGDMYQGYVITAPLGADGKLNVDLWKNHKKQCIVVRYGNHDEDKADGILDHRGDKWFFTYDEVREGPDEDVYHLGDHRLWVGDYVTIADRDGESLIYVVSETN
ncbi:MAG: hypothetical protein FD163_900 [Hyphomonadaceae bacterium]|nr:MAG: hypothetical protein FD163_900 [Hyphomonadaceae bacterium]